MFSSIVDNYFCVLDAKLDFSEREILKKINDMPLLQVFSTLLRQERDLYLEQTK